ncbi:pilus assembly protein N-terminal domain-containing protein [Bradyrhizobium sp. USDA 4506]
MLLVVTVLVCTEAFAQSRRLMVEVGKGMKLEGVQNAESVFVADPAIADVSKSPGDALFIYGKSPGGTTLIASDLSGKTLFKYDVVVIHPVSELRRMLAQRLKAGNISISSARGSILISGVVDDELERQNVIASLKSSVPDSVLIDELVVRKGKLIRLDVKLLEVARDKLERYGIDWLALISGTGATQTLTRSTASLNATLNLLTANGVATIVAESTLITVSNRKADFSVGEEIAIPTFAIANSASLNSFGIDFKFVGINVTFLPIIMPGGRVALEINSIVSNMQATARQINGNSFPNLASRKLTTNVELEGGRSTVIGGLSRLETSAALPKPSNGTSEFVRTLLGSEQIESLQKDLIIVVTPRFDDLDKPAVAQIVRPLQNNLEFILSRKVMASGSGDPASIRIIGPAGFLY